MLLNQPWQLLHRERADDSWRRLITSLFLALCILQAMNAKGARIRRASKGKNSYGVLSHRLILKVDHEMESSSNHIENWKLPRQLKGNGWGVQLLSAAGGFWSSSSILLMHLKWRRKMQAATARIGGEESFKRSPAWSVPLMRTCENNEIGIVFWFFFGIKYFEWVSRGVVF